MNITSHKALRVLKDAAAGIIARAPTVSMRDTITAWNDTVNRLSIPDSYRVPETNYYCKRYIIADIEARVKRIEAQLAEPVTGRPALDPVTFDSDRAITICGVPARLTHRTVKPGKAPGLWFKQRIVTAAREIKSGDYKGCHIKAELCFDDKCGNGHNTFAITGEINESQRFVERTHVASGCIHDEIATHFPELAHLIKWHLCSDDGPMHYIANTVYHAGDRDSAGKRHGDVLRTETRLRFTGCPITHKVADNLSRFIRAHDHDYGCFTAMHAHVLDIVAVPHADAGKPGAYQYGPKFTFSGLPVDRWYQAPFDSARDAEEFRDALMQGYEWVTVPTAYSEGKPRDFDAARACGVWPDATDEQLSAEPGALRGMLMARLPALLSAMRHDIEGAGFFWTPADLIAAATGAVA